MNAQQALDYIHSRPRPGQNRGLHRIRALLGRLGDPQKQLKFVHVAGTNGKGSTTAMIAAMLEQGGYRTGRFLSPYVLCFRERIQINGDMIGPEELAQVTAQVKAAADQMEEAPTEFEVVTACAMVWFARQRCQIVVLETGLGGRQDATNVIEAPLVAVFTHIGLDHVDILGHTVEQIATEKSGIIKPGCPVVCSYDQDLDAVMVLMTETSKAGGKFVLPGRKSMEVLQADLGGSTLRRDGQIYRLPLGGAHQVCNFATALAVMDLLAELGFPVSTQQRADGMGKLFFPARMEILSREPLVILDGAHNQLGAVALRAALEALNRPVTAVVGMLQDKNPAGFLAQLAPQLCQLVAVTPQSPRALPAEELAQLARSMGLPAEAGEGVAQAVDRGIQLAGAEGAVVICGSLYLASQARRLYFPAG